MRQTVPINRRDFVRKFMDSGLSYEESRKAYETMTRIFEDAICSGAKINIGNVLSIVPVWMEPRVVNMGFERVKNCVKKTQRTYYLGQRIRYRVNLYREFIRTHSLNWI